MSSVIASNSSLVASSETHRVLLGSLFLLSGLLKSPVPRIDPQLTGQSNASCYPAKIENVAKLDS